MRREGYVVSDAGRWFWAVWLLAGVQAGTMGQVVAGVAYIQPDTTYRFTGNLTLGLRETGDYLRFEDDIEHPGIAGEAHQSNTTYLLPLIHRLTRVEVTNLRTRVEDNRGQLRTRANVLGGDVGELYLSLVAPRSHPVHYSVRIYVTKRQNQSFF